MAVGLPPEIVQEYAGRIAERFPRLFLQLGSPSLHGDYKLQTVDGARVKVSETPSCMTVELRLPRRAPCAPQQKPEAQQAQEETENEDNPPSSLASSRRPSKISSNSTNSGAAREESGSDEDMLSPFSKGRMLSRAALSRNLPGDVEELQQMPCLTRPPEGVFTRPYNGTLGERANSTIAKARGDPAQPQPVAPVQALWPADGEIKITPSAAGIERPKLLRPSALGGFERMDPGKPVLSRPGSHDPWRSGDYESSQGPQL